MRAISCSEEVKDSTVLKYDKMLTAISCITVSGTSAVFSKKTKSKKISTHQLDSELIYNCSGRTGLHKTLYEFKVHFVKHSMNGGMVVGIQKSW